MDCMDCHNRPSHQFAATPERAVDQAIANGELERTLPFIRREAVRAIKQTYPTQDAGFSGIASSLTAFYYDVDHAGASGSSCGRPSHCRGAARLWAERVPHDEGHLGHLREQPGSSRLPRLLQVPRRQSQGERRNDHQSGLRALSQDGQLTGDGLTLLSVNSRRPTSNFKRPTSDFQQSDCRCLDSQDRWGAPCVCRRAAARRVCRSGSVNGLPRKAATGAPDTPATTPGSA